MTLQGIIDEIIQSQSADWNCISCWDEQSGPSYKDRFTFWDDYKGVSNVTIHQSHSEVCIYKKDISISIAYGLNLYRDSKDSQGIAESWATNHINPEPGKPYYADVFYNNGLVHRALYCSVDGGRCKLPYPHRDSQGNWVVEKQYSDFIKKVNELEGTTDYDDYFNRSGIHIVNSPWI
jgi:hypothetical protein